MLLHVIAFLAGSSSQSRVLRGGTCTLIVDLVVDLPMLIARSSFLTLSPTTTENDSSDNEGSKDYVEC